MPTDRIGLILWGHMDHQNPKPYLCVDVLHSKSLDCYVLVDLQYNIRMTLSVRDVDRIINESEAWWDDQGRRRLQPR